MLLLLGYWNEKKDFPQLYHPKYLIDCEWEKPNRAKIVEYLRNGIRIHEELGYSHCRFKNCLPNEEMGNAELTDGVWIWPEGLAHYVELHYIRLPDEFGKYVKSNNYIIPNKLDPVSLAAEFIDITFWQDWCWKSLKLHQKLLLHFANS